MNKKLIGILLAILVFVIGVVCGFVADRMVNKIMMLKRGGHAPQVFSKERMRDRFEKEFCRALDLTEEQKQKIDAIVKKNMEYMKKLHKEMSPKLEAARKSMENEIRSILTDQQKQKFEKMLKKFGRMHEMRGKFQEGRREVRREHEK